MATMTAGCNATTAATVWQGWAVNNSTSTITVTDPWPQWANAITVTGSATCTNMAWTVWADAGGTEWKFVPTPVQAPVYTEEERQRFREEAAAARLAEEQRNEAANRRALLLLMAILNAEQKKEYLERSHFHVTARSGRRYMVKDGSHGNLTLVDKDGKVLKRLCVQPTGIPKHDVMAGQALHLLDNEEEFVRKANVTCLTTARVANGSMDPDYAKWFAAEKETVAA